MFLNLIVYNLTNTLCFALVICNLTINSNALSSFINNFLEPTITFDVPNQQNEELSFFDRRFHFQTQRNNALASTAGWHYQHTIAHKDQQKTQINNFIIARTNPHDVSLEHYQENASTAQRFWYWLINQKPTLNSTENLKIARDYTIAKICNGNLMRWYERYESLELALKDLTCYKTHHTLHKTTIQLLRKNNISTRDFSRCHGNTAQQHLHKELVDIAQQAALATITEKNRSFVEFSQKPIITFAHAATYFNQQNDFIKGYTLADWCWKALSCAQAVVDGIVDGALCTVQYAADHPFETAAWVIAPKAMLAFSLAKNSFEIIDFCRQTIAFEVEQSQLTGLSPTSWEHISVPLHAISDAAHNYLAHASLEQGLHDGTVLAATLFFQHRLCTGLQSLYGKAERAIKVATQAKVSTQINAPKLNSSFRSNTSESSKGVNLPFLKQENIPSFIKENRVPKAHETILATKNFQKTKLPRIKGAAIYKGEDSFYHIDTLHKGKSAHLEVYNKRGEHLGTADPLTGILHPNSKVNGRTLF